MSQPSATAYPEPSHRRDRSRSPTRGDAPARERERERSRSPGPTAATPQRQILIIEGAHLDVWRLALGRPELTQEALVELHALLTTKKRAEFKLYGKVCQMRRKQAFFAAPGAVTSYRFSNTTFPAEPHVPALVQACIDFMNTTYKTDTFNAALAILYEDGSDYISPHSDDEPEHGAGGPIGTFSFGPGVRKMVFKIKKSHAVEAPKKRVECELEQGSCVVMRGPRFQEALTHEIPKQKAVNDWRLSVTVRHFRADYEKKKKKSTQKKE